ncbi:MAG TPA: hypothetical protein VK550_28085 [Polyangiaceae bacterium]|nr:hypothetical protein [Polyangiaceae bacterium]
MKSSHRQRSFRALAAASLLAAAARADAEPPAREEPPPAAPANSAAPPVARSGEAPPSVSSVTDAPRAMEEVLLLRTAIVGGAEASTIERPTSRELLASAQAQKLDLLLSDAIQDLGLTLDLSERSTQDARELTDVELVARASKGGRWVIYPSVDARGSESVVRLAAVAPGTKTVIVRAEPVKAADLAVRTVVMLRDVVSKRAPAASETVPPRPARSEPVPTFAVPARSQGRATLAFNSALFGGFVGYSVQRGSGSDDPRLLFPLMALGTGLGLGASAIIAEEWDVGLGDAWYLSAGAWWPAMSGLFLARSRRQVDPSSEYGYAIVGALTGLGLTTASLAIGGGMSEGGALLTHSGGAFGFVLGGMTELAIRNGSSETPHRGLGIGTAAGVLIAGAAATRLEVEPSRVLIIDLGAGLGGLAGAAAASPFIVRDRTEGGDRAFLLTTMGTTVAGGIAAWLWTRKTAPAPAAALSLPRFGVGVIAESLPGFGPSQPVVGLDVSGALP